MVNTQQIQVAQPTVVLAADENFAMPLAATVRSALDHLAADQTLDLYVLDGGIRDATKERLEKSWPTGRFNISWVEVDPTSLADVPTSDRVSKVAYYRILMPRLLPAHLSRVIYLDADLIVRTDLTSLWNQPLEGAPCLAVQDCAAPYLDSSQALSNYAQCGPHLGACTPVSNYRDLGLEATAPYFNSGVLLVDLDAWRKMELSTQFMNCLEINRQHVRWWDQYALNVVLSGLWKPLDPRWNQGAHVYVFRKWTQSPYDRETFRQVRSDPHVIHFTTQYKPWKVSCLHPLRQEFYRYLDRTEWSGWRPAWFDSPKTVLELAKAQQRWLRLARRRLQDDVRDWLLPPRWGEAQ